MSVQENWPISPVADAVLHAVRIRAHEAGLLEYAYRANVCADSNEIYAWECRCPACGMPWGLILTPDGRRACFAGCDQTAIQTAIVAALADDIASDLAEEVSMDPTDPLHAFAPAEYVAALTDGREPDRAGFLCCPLHDERTASFRCYDDHWYCFGCGRGGTIYDFAAALWDVDTRGTAFVELRERLARELLGAMT